MFKYSYSNIISLFAIVMIGRELHKVFNYTLNVSNSIVFSRCSSSRNSLRGITHSPITHSTFWWRCYLQLWWYFFPLCWVTCAVKKSLTELLLWQGQKMSTKTQCPIFFWQGQHQNLWQGTDQELFLFCCREIGPIFFQISMYAVMCKTFIQLQSTKG